MKNIKRVKYADLNAKQKENYNFQKVAGALAAYSFNCTKLADDWQGADFSHITRIGKIHQRFSLRPVLPSIKNMRRKDFTSLFPSMALGI